jgi:serine/threonine protein kinase
METPKDSGQYMIHLAAEGMAGVIAGCAAVLAAGTKGSASAKASSILQLKGINYFGPAIIERWLTEFKPHSSDEQIQRLVKLAELPPSESHEEASAAVDKLAGGASAVDKQLAIEYLTAIPLAVRRSLVADPATGKLTLAPTLASDQEQTLIGVLPADVPPFPIGSLVPGTSYHLEELLGIGGFGAVYRAMNRFEQNQPPRAIKFCLDPSMVASLQREQAILDRLMAVGGKNWSDRIVRLYGYALDVHPPFLVYEHVPGGDLTGHLVATRNRTGRGFRPAVALELVRQVAEALAFAHGQGLVHRDLKPANILVSGSTIKLTDFGIGGVVSAYARRAGASVGTMTAQGNPADHAFLLRGSGTPLYMSPEQRRGDQPDPRHDLFSLGVVWYQLLVGDVTRELSPGWQDELTEEFQIPVEHIDLIGRCVGYFKKRPANAGDLLSLLANPGKSTSAAGPVRPRPEGYITPPPAAPLSAFERLNELLTDQIEREALYQARETVAAMLKLRPDDPETSDVKLFIEERLAALPKGDLYCFDGLEGWVRGVAISPNGLVGLSGGDDAMVRAWDLKNGKSLRCLAGHEGPVMSVALLPDSRRALSGGWDGTLRLWDLGTGKELGVIAGDWKAVRRVAIAPDGRYAVFAADDLALHLVDLQTGKDKVQYQGHTDLIQAVIIAPDGRRAMSASDDRTVRLWDLPTGREIRKFVGHSDSVLSVAMSPDGSWFASGSSDNTIRLWETDNGAELCRLMGHTNWVNALAISASGSRLLSGSGGEFLNGKFHDGHDTTLRLWDVATGYELRRLTGHQASVTSIALSASAGIAISGSLDKTVRVWGLHGA